MENEIQVQARTVEKIGLRLIEVGASDSLTERLRTEEAKLRDLRHSFVTENIAWQGFTPSTKVDLDRVVARSHLIQTVFTLTKARIPSRPSSRP